MSTLFQANICSPIGTLVALADDMGLCFLEFPEWTFFEHSYQKATNDRQVIHKQSCIIKLAQQELESYFKGMLKSFKTPLTPQGTVFQNSAWQALQEIPYGQTKSYREQAIAINKATAYRAVARANATNPIAVMIPCHRIINSNGNLGGYSGGLERKQWLLNHEAQNCSK